MQIYKLRKCTNALNTTASSVSLESLTPGIQQQWLESQPPPKTKEEVQERRRVKRLIRLAKDEEKE